MALTAAQQQQAIAANNAAARALIVSRGLYRRNQIFQSTFNPVNQPVLNVIPQNVGLIHGFLVKISATLTPSVNGATLTELGASNLLSQVVFLDLNNNTRIQTTGWHLHMLASCKKQWPFGAVRANLGYPVDFGNNWVNNFSAPAVANGPVTVNFTYWVPLAYSKYDLRGGVFAGVVNATMNLQLVPNPAAFVAAGDATLGVYAGQAGTITSMTVKVYQYYYDQLPVDPNSGATILPFLDMGTIYDLKNTNFVGMTAGQDFPMPYSNFRDFLSTFAIYDNGGTLAAGTDINYWELQSANFTNVWKLEPDVAALEAREIFQDDLPLGTYYFDSRGKPLSTVQSGNLQLILNPIGPVNQGAQVLVGYEAFAQVNTLVGAASLAGGGA
jgi:hypothetical protein